MQTEPALIEALGDGPQFVSRIFRRFKPHFAVQRYDPKRCSAYLNLVAEIRMLDGNLWTDRAVESMFRRLLRKGLKS